MEALQKVGQTDRKLCFGAVYENAKEMSIYGSIFTLTGNRVLCCAVGIWRGRGAFLKLKKC